MPVIQALGDGYDVYIVTDASGGVSVEAHNMGVLRMIQAGAVPITWMAVEAELQRDWARESTIASLADILFQHGGGSGVAFAWESQLLAGKGRPGRISLLHARGLLFADTLRRRLGTLVRSTGWRTVAI